jgi:hypothetical protein
VEKERWRLRMKKRGMIDELRKRDEREFDR